MGSNVSRHYQQNSSTVPQSLGDVDLIILRRIQAIIDSCVGVLKQPDFLDFDDPLTNEHLSDLSHLLYQSFPTQKAGHNDLYSLNQYLFRSSTFSLFGHLILNSQTFINYTKKIEKVIIYKILHVITGTPGMGKTASRFPFITLLMSFGVESVTTLKDGEQVYVFKRREKRERTGTAKISMDVSSGTLPDFETPSYLYTFDVHSFKVPKSALPPAEPKGNLKEKLYVPDAVELPGPEESKPGWTLLGSVSVPSVEHFPYFLRLLVGHQSDTLTATNPPNADNQICQEPSLVVVNRLENTKWHVVDDLTISEDSMLQRDTNYVLFTSPKGSRWKNVGTPEKTDRRLTLEYVVPKYTPQEQAALLNTMGTRGISETHVDDTLQGVELFSFVPRFVLNPGSSLDAMSNADKPGTDLSCIDPQDLFTDKVSHKLIHFSCPQYDCHNWHTEFATELARWITLNTYNTTMQEKYIETLENMSESAEFNQQRGAVFHALVSESILGGFWFTSAKHFFSDESLLDGVQLPPPIGESFVYLRNSVCMRKVFLPDMKTIDVNELNDFEEKWARLFSTPNREASQTNIDDDTSNLERNTRQARRNKAQAKKPSPHTMHSDVDEAVQATINHDEENPEQMLRDESHAKCFTFYLKPIGGNNAGFDSLLLFFKVHEEQGELKLDDLSAMFIQSTLAKAHPISDSGANLMYLWLKLLCTVYGLSEQHIHPFFFFVKQPSVSKISLTRDYPAESFMPRENVWVMDGHARELKEILLARTGRLVLSAATTLEPNTNPTHFRCYFCDQIVKEYFPCHHCKKIPDKYEEARRTRKEQSLSQTKEQSSSKTEDQMFDTPYSNQTQENDDHIFEFDLIPTRPLNPGNGANPVQPEQKWIDLSYPYPERQIPKSKRSMTPFDRLKVVMVGVGGQTVSTYEHDFTSNEQERKRLRFDVSHSQPIPNIFTYSPQRPNDPQPSVPIDETWNRVLSSDSEQKIVVGNEFNNTTSHLLTSVRLVRVWANERRIGLSGDIRNGVLSMGEQHSPHEDVSDKLENKGVPLAQLHLPMNFFPKQTLLLGTRRILTPFEIRGDSLSC
ncbi:hypothetical protein BLNAU_24623 [Blattamonas nauphoetae]|uniref:Uncharacterized protein n=1 Tax=Blattamonas nauphoetae TaxID=2049346 RepID=A0ABQ9WM99_9EUKA|nr:hypothetical protein BLNAU_24623 [Blattamonas nauphoetae]